MVESTFMHTLVDGINFRMAKPSVQMGVFYDFMRLVSNTDKDMYVCSICIEYSQTECEFNQTVGII